MPFIPRQVKPPARLPITCKLPEALASLLKHYAEFLDSSQEYVVTEILRVAFRRDKEFHDWLATTHPEVRHVDRPVAAVDGDNSSEPAPRPTRARP